MPLSHLLKALIFAVVLTASAMATSTIRPGLAQDTWDSLDQVRSPVQVAPNFQTSQYRDPYVDQRQQPPPAYAPERNRKGAPPSDNAWQSDIQSENLAPITAGSGSAMPYDLWTGLSVTQVEKLIAQLSIPPRSATIHKLWTGIMGARAEPPITDRTKTPFAAVKSEALYRSGLLEDAYLVFDHAKETTEPSVLAETLKARAAIAANRSDTGCPIAKTLVRKLGSLPKSLNGAAILMIGYCAVVDNNRAAAGLAADLASDNGMSRSPGVSALRAFSVNTKPQLASNAPMTLMDFRIVERIGGRITRAQVTNAKPALLTAIATSRTAPVDVRIAAGEAALKYNAITLRDMTDIYRSALRTRQDIVQVDTDGGSNFGDELRRATLFNTAEAEQSPLRKARSIRGFLDSARQAGFYWHGLKLMADPANQLALLPEIGWFAETGIEASLASGDQASARRWATFAAAQRSDGGADLSHWQGLIEIADHNPSATTSQARGLALIENAARRGLFDPVLLHRLAMVLDALDMHVPIPLWEMASRTPQPTTGHLPETGVLSALKDAAKNRQQANLVLLIMKTLGPAGAEGAHMIALGDAIRALRRSGYKSEARQLGLEALFGSWPRAIR